MVWGLVWSVEVELVSDGAKDVGRLRFEELLAWV